MLKGGLRLGAYPNACNAANAGVLRWTGKHFEACNGKRFMVIRLFVGPGSSDNPVGANCKEVADASPGGKNGLYWLKPGKGAAFQVWCDLSSHDGCWSLALNLDTNNNLSHHYFDTTFWTTSKTEGELSAARVSDHKSRVFSEMPVTEIMIEAHIEGTRT